ncbi:MAG: glycosyltransferase family 39 protein [Victivallaceae bacterium]|jgi:hypothetical protein
MDIKKYLIQNKILAVSVGIAFLISLAHIFFCVDVFNDIAGSYGPMAGAFGAGDWENAFPENVPPLLPSLAGILCIAGINTLTALIIVSSLFYILAIFPLYHLLKLYLKPEHAALGCLLYVAAPKIIRFSCTGLPDAGRNFFLITAIWLLLSYFRKNSAVKLLFLALCLGGLALVRAEGVVYLPLFLGWFIIMHFRNRGAVSFLASTLSLLKKLAIVLVLLLIVISPRMYQVHSLTGIPAIDSRQSDVIAGLMDFSLPVIQSDDAIALPEPGARQHHVAISRLLVLLECFCSGSYELYLALAIAGILLLRKRNQISLEHWVLFSFVICNALIFFVILMSERFFNVNTMLLMPFIVPAGLAVYDFLCSKGLRQAALIAFTIMVSAQVCIGSNNVFNLKQNERSKVGKWIMTKESSLLQETGKNDIARKIVILSDKPQYAFWANAEWAKSTGKKGQELPPLEVLQAQNVDIAVVEKEDSPIYLQIIKSPHFKQILTPFYEQTGIFLFIPDKTAPDYVPSDDVSDDDSKDKMPAKSGSSSAPPAEQP